jgi:transposase
MIISITNNVIDMGMTPQLITEELYTKAHKTLSQMSATSRVAIRLRAIVSAKEHGVNLVARILNITSNTLRNWVKAFQKDGETALMYEKGRGRKSKLSDLHKRAILSWTQQDCNLTINKILFKLEEEFGLQSSKSAVHRTLGDLNLSYITPRPRHYKQDPSKKDEFKKKST